MKALQVLKVEEAPIHHVERARLGQQLINDVDVVHLVVADMEIGMLARRSSRMCSLTAALSSERAPTKAPIGQINRFLQIDTKGLVDIQRANDGDQPMRI